MIFRTLLLMSLLFTGSSVYAVEISFFNIQFFKTEKKTQEKSADELIKIKLSDGSFILMTRSELELRRSMPVKKDVTMSRKREIFSWCVGLAALIGYAACSKVADKIGHLKLNF